MLRSLCAGIKELLYPRRCLACQKSLKTHSGIDNLICAQCWQSIKRNTPPFCHSCGRHLEPRQIKREFHRKICSLCIKQPLGFDRAYSPCQYEGVIKELIHLFKYQQKEYLGKPLSSLMAEFIAQYQLPIEYFDAIVPIPLHPVRMREREFNQTEILGRYLAQACSKPLDNSILTRQRPTKTQTELIGPQRFENVAQCFAVTQGERIRGKSILLIDDVLTTGATASEAAKTLKNAGAGIVFTLTLAN
jgi:competence protein ComFC